MTNHLPKIQTLKAQVEVMKEILLKIQSSIGLISTDLDLNQEQVKNQIKNLQRSHQTTQELFQTQLLDQILPEQEELVPHYVEINKQLRLLSADINLLKTARQPETLNQRLDKAGDRLNLLLTYCDGLLVF